MKGAYSFIAYPESADISVICEKITGSGGQWCYILHDKDMSGDQPKKPHWHIIAGWERGFPRWDTFADMCESCGAVALSPSACSVRDIQGIEDYLTHKKKPSKHQYDPGEVQRSKRWHPELYVTEEVKRDEKRKQRRLDDAGDYSEIFQIIRDRKLFNYSTLLDQLAAEKPELFARAVERAYPIQAYISGCNVRLDYETEIADLQDTISQLADDAADVGTELCKALKCLVTVWEFINDDDFPYYGEADLENLLEWANKKFFSFSKCRTQCTKRNAFHEKEGTTTAGASCQD